MNRKGYTLLFTMASFILLLGYYVSIIIHIDFLHDQKKALSIQYDLLIIELLNKNDIKNNHLTNGLFWYKDYQINRYIIVENQMYQITLEIKGQIDYYIKLSYNKETGVFNEQ